MNVAYSNALVFGDICENCFCSCELRCSRAEWILLPCCFYLTKGCATLQGSKLVINKTFAQSRSFFLQLWPSLFQGWVYFTPLFRSSKSEGVAFEAHTSWARLILFKETFVQIVFAVGNCAVVALSVFYSFAFNVQSDIFAVMTAWS